MVGSRVLVQDDVFNQDSVQNIASDIASDTIGLGGYTIDVPGPVQRIAVPASQVHGWQSSDPYQVNTLGGCQ